MYHRIGKNGKKFWGKKGAGIFFTNGDNVLLLKRSDKGDGAGTWGIPGGKAEDGETAIGTATREAREECGRCEGDRFETLDDSDGLFNWTTFFYKVKTPFTCKLSDEHTDWKWVPLKELSDFELHPKLKENIGRYLKVLKKNMDFKEWLDYSSMLSGEKLERAVDAQSRHKK